MGENPSFKPSAVKSVEGFELGESSRKNDNQYRITKKEQKT